MTFIAWGDDWFRRVASFLVLAQVALLVVWAAGTTTPDSIGFSSDTPAATSVDDRATAMLHGTAPAAAPGGSDAGSSKASASSKVINDGLGKVGPIKLGMTLGQAREALGEELVAVQVSRGASKYFEYLAPEAGLKIEGIGRKVDTITVTNTKAGRQYQTTKGIRIGSNEYAVQKEYLYARIMCGTEWWVNRGEKTLRFPAAGKVSAIKLTDRKRSTFVECT